MPASTPNSNKDHSKTALLTAFYRAAGNIEFKDHRVGSDNLAKYFLPLYLRILIKSSRMRAKGIDKLGRRMPGVYEYILARTAFFDDVFVDALNNNIPQIVLLGAGYDTRAFRFKKLNASSRIIEIDNAETQRRKINCLKKHKIETPKQVAYAQIDFTQDSLNDALQNAGYQKDQYTLFLWEGVCMYLTPKSIDAVLDFMTSHRKSTAALDYAVMISAGHIGEYYGARELIRTIETPHSDETFKFLIPENEVESFFSQRGIKIIKSVDHTQMEETFLLGHDGRRIGKPNGMFRFAIAKPD